MRKRLPFLKRASRGQTIVILAFAFIVLLGFVGLVTDISLMFVRYNTLRRAVDAAAVAAAGQVRRYTPTAAEIAQAQAVDPANYQKIADGYAFARNVATVNLAARQFIEFYGLSPSAVLVDTCATTPTDGDLHCGSTETPRKLVKVTAQLQSPTVFLRLLGWSNVQLEASSISETAVLDVVLIFDAGESMANQTSYDDWAAEGYDMHYYPPNIGFFPAGSSQNSLPAGKDPFHPVGYRCCGGDYNYVQAWNQTLGMTQQQIDADTTDYPVYGYKVDTAHNITAVYTPAQLATAPGQPVRTECRVRFFADANSIEPVSTGTGNFATADNIQLEYTNFLRSTQIGALVSPQKYSGQYDGFVPVYNYYGCCNDPDGNWDFSDMVCQPMQQMRKHTEDFLKNIDFTRGDRVALVTFDRSAYLIDPDGSGPQTPMITSQDNAIAALDQDVGVRAEGSYYADAVINGSTTLGSDGKWDSFVVGGPTYNPTDPNHSGTPMTFTQHLDLTTKTWVNGGFDNTAVGQLTDYPVANNCRFQNAELSWPYSIYASPPPDGSQSAAHPYVGQRFPTALAAFGQPISIMQNFPAPSGMTIPPTLMLPNLNDTVVGWNNAMRSALGSGVPPQDPTDPTQYPLEKKMPVYSYEAAAGCGSANVGAGLRVANNALLDPNTVRTNGSVWVMVLLGNAAASSTDPARRTTGELLGTNPYGDPTQPPVGGQYGAFGLCPYGTDPNNPGALLDNNGTQNANFNIYQPRCSDYKPETRHPFCFFPNDSHTDANNNIYINLDDDPRCSTQYDADDYAHDWADYVGLSNPFPEITTSNNSQNRNAQQLPTIFTIGFGLNFPLGDGSGPANPADYLGEELMRYIADVGDNQRIDSDIEQDVKADGVPDFHLTNGETTYGDRGPCENPVVGYASADDAAKAGNYGAIWNPMAPKTNCGNYYWAPDAAHLQQVFEDIASRMFTRLTS